MSKQNFFLSKNYAKMEVEKIDFSKQKLCRNKDKKQMGSLYKNFVKIKIEILPNKIKQKFYKENDKTRVSQSEE